MKSISRTSKSSHEFKKLTILCITLFIGLCLPLSIRAQTVEYTETSTVLQMKVHLKLGETTLAKTLQEMSKQTGLHIQPMDYLEDRELLVALDNISAEAALDTLAEANDWIWYETKQNGIFMARPKFDKTQQLLNVASAFRAIVPKDLRHYVGVDVSNEEIRSAFQRSQTNSDHVLNPKGADYSQPRLRLLPKMLEAPVKEQESQMISWVTEEVKAGHKIPYSKLTSEQQHGLLVRFVLTAMHTIFSNGPKGAANLIIGLDPTGIDENKMRIVFKDGVLFIGTLQEGRISSGEQIMSEQQFPDPLFQHTKF